LTLAATTLAWVFCPGCGPDEPNVLQKMPADIVRVGDHSLKVWIARTPDERERGLMFITAEEMAPLPDGTERGMLFLFDRDQSKSMGFWMRNTFIPLDIAFIRADGAIVTIHTMAPLDERLYRPTEAYRYALEVNANVFSRLGVRVGDNIQIPEAVLKRPN